jgi:hypothetical protein
LSNTDQGQHTTKGCLRDFNQTQMKKLLLIVIMLFTVSTYSQTDSTAVVQTTITETERIIDKYSDKIGAFLESTAEALKVPVAHVYEILVRQAIAEAITYTIVGILGIISMFICIKFLVKEEEIKRDTYDFPLYGIVGGGIGIAGLMFLVVFAFSINNIVTGFVNPEYYAIHEILDILK